MGDDSRDAATGVQPGVGPVFAGVRRAVHPVAEGDVAPDVGLPGAHPNHVRVGDGDRNRPHREHGLIVEDRRPVDPAIGRLEHPTGSRAEVVGVRVSRHAVDGRHPVPHRADVPPAEGVEAALGGEGRGSARTAGERRTSQEREAHRRSFPHPGIGQARRKAGRPGTADLRSASPTYVGPLRGRERSLGCSARWCPTRRGPRANPPLDDIRVASYRIACKSVRVVNEFLYRNTPEDPQCSHSPVRRLDWP